MDDFHIPRSLEEETAYLVAAQVRQSQPLLTMEDSLKELRLLSKTAGMKVVGQATQMLNSIDPSTYIGSGKLDEIAEEIDALGAHVLIFDDELSPRHQREIEKRISKEVKVLDRSALILDIFAQHAQTREGALQVELAQYEYRLPRLTRQWTHLARQAGGSGSAAGVGLRGPGETQLEVDRREIGRKITKLKSDLEQVRQHRSRHRRQRSRTGIPVVAIVGYTNAGKSTLLNAVTNANVYAADQLFATLDPTTRKVELPSGRHVLFTDTVGFIQKLPTTLIAAFRATLEEVVEADLILHVIDLSHPNVKQHIEAVEDTLAEIDVPAVPHVLVMNKIDKLEDEVEYPVISDELFDAKIKVSAQQQTGLDDLLQAIEDILASQLKQITLLLPYERGDLLSYLYENANIIEQENTDIGFKVIVQIPGWMKNQFEEFQV